MNARRQSDYPHKGIYGIARRSLKWIVVRVLRVLNRRGLYLAAGPLHPLNRIELKDLQLELWWEVRDFVRYGALELMARELDHNQVPGAVAELGVFQGYFSAVLSRRFPDRDIYLFDTFSSFDQRDLDADENHGMEPDSVGDFARTSLPVVLQRMPFSHHVHPVPGWFPESAARVHPDVRFALVSLDADLYGPISAGLDWFYPRLSRGGYIVVHDVNNAMYPGARQALSEWCLREGLAFVPLPDSGGSAVVAKPLGHDPSPTSAAADRAPDSAVGYGA